MKNTRATYRYAKSLLDLSTEQGVLESCKSDIETIVSVCKKSRELVLLLKSPVVKADKKIKILGQVFPNLSLLTTNFVELITKNKRESLLFDIAQQFLLVYKKTQGIQTAHLTAATPLDTESRALVMNFIHSQDMSKVELTEKVDKSLIGGVIINLGDKQIDVSIARQIKNLKQIFNKNLYIKDF